MKPGVSIAITGVLPHFSINSFAQKIITTRLKNGNFINFNIPNGLNLWTNTDLFNPSSLLKNENYNIACYTYILDKPDNLVQLFGLKQLSSNYFSRKEYNNQIVSIFKKQAIDSVAVSHTWNSKLNLIVENYISHSSLEKQMKLRILVDSMYHDLNKEKYVKEKVELFHKSPTTIILGIVSRFEFPTLDTTFTIASFSGFILLKNHA